jgi:flagellar assembly factor FliW
MQWSSTRFGRLEIPDDAVVEFPSGLVGLGGARFTLLARSDDAAFLWLQSLDDADLALPVVNPWEFFDEYALELTQADADRAGLGDRVDGTVLVTVRAAETGGGFSANLRAPIVIVGSVGHQLINQADDAPVRAPLGHRREPLHA